MSEMESGPSPKESYDLPQSREGEFLLEQSEVDRFPDYRFDLRSNRLFSDGVIEITPESRLRYCLHAIADTCGQDFPAFEAYAETKVAHMELDNRNKYLNFNVSKIPKVTIKRRELVDYPNAVGDTIASLTEQNHPASQILRQIDEQFASEIPPAALHQLHADLVTVTAWTQLKANLVQQIDVLKALSVA